MLDRPASNPGRKRFVRNFEKGATDNLQHQSGGLSAIDWGAIDWAKLFSQILAFIKALLAMFGA